MLKRVICYAVALAVLVSVCIISTSCKGKNCKHTYDTKWSYDANNHWLAATCGHDEMTKLKGPHADTDGDEKCDTCGCTVPKPNNDNQGGNPSGGECEHQYYNACDADCNKCGAVRTPADHVYDNACDASCNTCDAKRMVDAHVYSNACDATCNECGAERTVGAHVYDNACDTDCNVCGAERTTGAHAYDNACDTDCNECGAVRTPADHVFDNACDTDCNVCGAKRQVGDHAYGEWVTVEPPTTTATGLKKAICTECGAEKTETIPKLDPTAPEECEHVYDNTCDTKCNKCGEERVTNHVYSNACDADCNVCGTERTPSSHVYDNACDASCNVCLTNRTPAAHVYSNACDATCDECGASRTAGSHIYSNACDTSCNECGATRTVGSHVYSNACDTSCNECGATRTVGAHTYGAWVTVKEPTTTTTGLKKATCTACGHEKQATIPKIETENPGTSSGGGITDGNWDNNPGSGNTGSGNQGSGNTGSGDDNTGSGGTSGSGAYVPTLPTVNSTTQSKLDQLDKDREAYHNTALSAISSYLGGADAVAALKQIYAMFDSDYYLLMAHLFDPGIGGFYYSISARDNVGFLPDLESSRQALNMVNTSGLASAYSNNWINLFSEDEKNLIAKFVQDMRGDDGYYYHPQWGTNVSTSRKSRDLTSAKFILDSLGLLESTVSLDSYASGAVALTARVGASSAACAASRVVAASTGPAHLASEAAFRAYMEEREDAMKSNSYSTGNLLSAQVGEINAAGYHSILISYLNDWQYDNGLWESTVSYSAINGLMKISMMYTTDDLKASITKTKAALNSLMDFMLAEIDANGNLTDEALAAVEGITFVYNPWVSMAKLAGALTGTDKTSFDNQLKANAANLINATYKKLCVFKKNDGGFSYNPTSSSYQSQGEIVALRGMAESDVNATTIAAGMVVNHILPVFGVPTSSMPKLFTEADSEMFYELLASRTPVEKVVIIGTPVKVTYDAYQESEGDTDGGVLLYPDYSITTNIGDTDTENGEYIWFQSGIVANPDATKTDNVLYAESFVRDVNGDGKYETTDSGKEVAPSGKSSSTDFRILNYAAEGNTYIFETEIYVNPVTSTGCVAELFFTSQNTNQSSAKLQLLYENGTLTIKEAQYSTGSDGKYANVTGIAVRKWVKLRFELTKTYTGSTLTSMDMKIYVDGVLKNTFNTGSYSATNAAYNDYIIDAFRFSYFRSANTKFYFNNTYAAKITE